MSLAAETPGLTDVTTWVNFGVLGLLVLAMITGWVWPKPSVDKLNKELERAIEERKAAEAARDAMATVFQDKLLPVVSEFISTTRAFLPVLQQLQQLQAMLPVLQSLARTSEDASEAKEPKGRRRKRSP